MQSRADPSQNPASGNTSAAHGAGGEARREEALRYGAMVADALESRSDDPFASKRRAKAFRKARQEARQRARRLGGLP